MKIQTFCSLIKITLTHAHPSLVRVNSYLQKPEINMHKNKAKEKGEKERLKNTLEILSY